MKIPLLKKVKPEFLLIIILVLAFFIRLYFFTGFIDADPQDDSIYIFRIKEIAKGKYNLEEYRELVKERTVNPAVIFKLRDGFLFPPALFVKLMGFNQIAYTLYPLISSLFLIFLAYYFGKNIFRNKVLGLISAFLLSIFPLDIVFSTKISPDIPLALFTSFSVYSFLYFFKLKNEKLIYPFIGGLLAGFASTIKTFGVILFPVLIFLVGFFHRYSKKNLKNLSYFLLGFFLIFSINQFYFYIKTGHIFLLSEISRKAQLDNLEKFSSTYSILNNFIIIKTTSGDPIEYFKLIFNLKATRPGVYYFGYFYFFFFPFLVYSLIYSKKKEMILAMFVWFSVGILFLEFFPIKIRLNMRPISLEWSLLPKHARYMSCLEIPTVLIISSGIIEVAKLKYGKFIVLVVIIFLFLSSCFFVEKTRNYFEDGIKDMKEVSKLVPQLNKTIYTDYLAVMEINYFTGFKYENKIRDFNNIKKENQLRDSYVIIGGSRSSDIYWEEPMESVPDFIKPIVKGITNNKWKLIKEIKGKKTDYRKYDLRVYYVPSS